MKWTVAPALSEVRQASIDQHAPLINRGSADHCGPARVQRMLTLTHPLVMGILNVTPDSFSDGGIYFRNQRLDVDLARERAEIMVQQGARIIDVGGESTRPGAAAISTQEELDRVIPVLEALHGCPASISVDTSSPEVMSAAVAAGADIINDVRALTRPGALQAAAATAATVCLMHMQGEPDSMQVAPSYADVTEDVIAYLAKRIDACVAAGISRDRVIVDPGFGFGKTLRHNLELLANLNKFRALDTPLLVGLSRKSMIGKILGNPEADRVVPSVSLALQAVARGAQIVRVHDVAETVSALAMLAALSELDGDS